MLGVLTCTVLAPPFLAPVSQATKSRPGGVPLQSYEDVPLALRDSFPLELKTIEQ